MLLSSWANNPPDPLAVPSFVIALFVTASAYASSSAAVPVSFPLPKTSTRLTRDATASRSVASMTPLLLAYTTVDVSAKVTVPPWPMSGDEEPNKSSITVVEFVSTNELELVRSIFPGNPSTAALRSVTLTPVAAIEPFAPLATLLVAVVGEGKPIKVAPAA